MLNYRFKYLKTDSWFKRKHDHYNHRITISLEYNPISFKENLNKCLIKFRLGGHIESLPFWKWCNQLNIGPVNFFHQYVFSKNCFSYFDPEILRPEDFFEPTESQIFKHQMLSQFGGGEGFSHPKLGEPISLDDFIMDLPAYMEMFKALHSPLALYRNKSGHWPEHLLLLIFEQEYDFAEQIIAELKNDYQHDQKTITSEQGLERLHIIEGVLKRSRSRV